MNTGLLFAADEPVVLNVNGKTPVIRYFDRVELGDGRVLFISPVWTTEQKLPRPLKGAKFDELRYVPHDKADSAGRVGISSGAIKSITLWEDMALADARKKYWAGDFEHSRLLLAELEKFNPGYAPRDRSALLNGMKLAETLESYRKAARGTPEADKALSTLEELRRDAPDTPKLGAALEEVLLPIARRLYSDKRYAESRDFLTRVQKAAPGSARARELSSQMQKDALALMSRAEAELRDDQGRAATVDAIAALKISPEDADLKRRSDAIFSKYQILNVASYENVVALDPFNAKRPLEKQLLRLLFDRLVETDETGTRFVKGPATAALRALPGFRKLENGSHAIAFEVELKPGQVFSDGSRITAASVAGTVRALANAEAAAHDPELARLLAGAEVRDPFHLVLLVRQHPYPESFFTFPIAPESLTVRLPKAGDPVSRKPVGSGPYVVAAHATFQDPLRLKANPKFRGAGEGQPLIREIAFPKYEKKGEGHAEEDLLQGKVHMISDPSPNQLNRLRSASAEFQTRPLRSNSVWILAINHRQPLCRVKGVRRAMQLAIDRGAILKQYFGTAGSAVVTGPFPPHSNANDPAIQVEPPQPAVAKKLLADAVQGGTVGASAKLTLKYPDDLTIEQAAVQIKRDLEAVGFQIELVKKFPNDLAHEVADLHDFDLAYWRIDHENVLFNVAAMFDASPRELAAGGTNFMGYAPQTLTQKFVDLRNAQQGEVIWHVQQQIHRLLADDYAFVPLWRLDHYIVYTNRLHGRDPNGKFVDLPFDQSLIFRQTEDWVLEPRQ